MRRSKTLGIGLSRTRTAGLPRECDDEAPSPKKDQAFQRVETETSLVYDEGFSGLTKGPKWNAMRPVFIRVRASLIVHAPPACE
jgi:hypothetical protein